MGRGWRWVGRDARARELTLLPLSRDEGIKYNRKGLPQLPGDAGTACILRGPDGSSEDLPLSQPHSPRDCNLDAIPPLFCISPSISLLPLPTEHVTLCQYNLRISGMNCCQQLDELILLFSLDG